MPFLSNNSIFLKYCYNLILYFFVCLTRNTLDFLSKTKIADIELVLLPPKRKYIISHI